ncbi:hypothetical protein DQ04_05131020 [Trypanosoma grayi]|uniref:hypothetical protein n=1 Tax=Trypanosoma grayi TaxID=71804 RepID=UPI0004F42EF1|nr:hypothetical protein DQ04_05131020 [Trypanosoma grayi]KEG09487.1 hypothetical protein DQ04_05131020 [Trypanosoma grayi]
MEENNGDFALAPAAAVIVSPERFQFTPRVKEECVVQVTNVSFETVLFRMLTTSPQRYLVKPTKGVIKPNASVNIVIVFNVSVAKKEGNPFLKSDDFRLEYSIMRPTDVIGPHCSNVVAIVKERKAANRRLVHVKTLRCTLNLPEEDEALAADANADAAAAARGTSERQQSPEGAETEAAVASLGSPERRDTSANGSASAGVAKMDPRELEQNTLAAKNRRQLAQQQKKNNKLLLIVFGALAVLLGILIMAR